MKINYNALPVLSVAFTRSTGIMGRIIQMVRGILTDKNAPNHALLITEDHGQLFATEETLHGLEEHSLEEYTKNSNRIVAVVAWNGFTPDKAEVALNYLAEIRRRRAEESKYDFKGLFSFLPLFKKFIKPDPKRQWCSENCASILKKYGAPFISDTTIAPDALLKIMKESPECRTIDHFYL